MAAPDTYFERTGIWSTAQEELRFLRQVENETDMELTIIGRSSHGRPIHRCDIGNPSGETILTTFAVHPTELACREAAQVWLRDAAYRINSEIASFLEHNRVIIIPTVNVDGHSHRPPIRFAETGLDLNRDHFGLIEPENRCIQRTIQEVMPVLWTDVHEFGTSRPDPATVGFRSGPSDPRLDQRAPAMREVTNDLENVVLPYIHDQGYSTEDWPGNAWTSHGTAAASGWVNNFPTVLIETLMYRPPIDRVRGAVGYHHGVVRYLNRHLDFVTQKIRTARVEDTEGTSQLFYHGTWANGNYSEPVFIDDPGFYTIPDEEDIPHELIEIYQIEMENRTIPTNQRARGVIPTLFDPRSFHYFARRYSPPALPVRGTGKVRINGVLADNIQFSFNPDYG